jgi:putative two-component system response regulator
VVSALSPESKILIVDDNIQNINLSVGILEWAGYENLKTVLDPTLAVSVFREYQPDLIILDLHMPNMDGFQVLEQLREYVSGDSYVPVLVFTADASAEARKRALALGASDFLTKPGDATEVLLRVQNFLKQRSLHVALEQHNTRLEERVFERTEELLKSRLETLECLAAAAEYRDDITGEHTKRVGEMSAQIAEKLGMHPVMVDLVRQAAPLHDIGKIGIADSILLKPSRLTDEEFEVMKRHTYIGAEILSRGDSPILLIATEIALYHHERWDGKGYCAGLRGEQIPLSARIVAVADAYDALTNDRPYQAARPIDQALFEIERNSGTQFDPTVVDAFLSLSDFEGFQTRRPA